MDHPIDAILETLPADPGVYLFKSGKGKVIYVGKAKNLRVRIRQYLRGQDERLAVPFLVRSAKSVEVVVVQTEKEALLLESTLIKKHRPRYNTKLVDDSSFLQLQIDQRAAWPRYLVRRQREVQHTAGVRTFGPFASASRARATLEFLGRRFPLRTCSDMELQSRQRPCLLHQMGRCLAPCVDLCTREEYAEVVDQSKLFLEGRDGELIERLRARMAEAAGGLRFEEAARHRDLIRAIESSVERANVVDPRQGSRDIWALHRDGAAGMVALVPMRRGLMEEAVLLPVDGLVGGSDADGDLLSSVLNTWYQEGAEIPGEVLLPLAPDDLDALSEVLGERRGKAVRLLVPLRGDKKRAVELAYENARSNFERRASDATRRTAALEELQRACRLPVLPHRIECFDNSNIQGTDAVAAMVVFIDGQPERSRYRRYKVKTVDGADDFATMAEIVGRRLRRGLDEQDLPDLLVVDGGKGQLNAALAIFRELGIRHQRQAPSDAPLVSIIGLSKPRTERAAGDLDAEDKVVLPDVKEPLRLRSGSASLRLLQHLRDQSHETAVGFHRRTRGRALLKSPLDDLAGVGPARRKALLRAFGNAAGVSAASVEEIAALPGFGPALAERILAALAPGGET